MGKHIWGALTSALTLIAGLWLMQAPFAFGYQPGGADWSDGTKNDFWVGLALALLSLLGVALFVQSLLAELRRQGVLRPRPAPKPATPPPLAAPAAPAASAASVANSAELERVLVPLATALLADMAERRKHTGAPPIVGRVEGGPVAAQSRAEGEGR